jgi:hypothetical protein
MTLGPGGELVGPRPRGYSDPAGAEPVTLPG